MKRRSIWRALLIVAMLVVALDLVLARWSGYGLLIRSPFSEADYPQQIAQISPIAAPTIDQQRLLTDLKALSYQRFTEVDRDRARSYITKALQEAGWTPQTQPFEVEINAESHRGINLYAERSGTDPSAGTILLAGHYDTVEPAPGADDNATAVATVLEAARLLGQQPTPRTLQLVLFDLEEEGLLGSKAFVEQIVNQENFRGAIVMDMIGFTCHTNGCQAYPPLPISPPSNQGDFLAAIGDQGHMPLLKSFSQVNSFRLPPVLALPVPTIGDSTPDLVRSDHASFWRAGLGAVLVTDTANFRNPNYHKSSDTLETIDEPFFLGAAQIVVNATAILLHGQEG